MASELDESIWQFFKDDGRVNQAAGEALKRIQWDPQILWTRIAERRGSGMMDARCVEIWCVKLMGVEPEIRHCYSMLEKDRRGEMVDKFAATFEALRSGSPERRVYEGMEAAAEGLSRFEREHFGHRQRQAMIGDDVIVTKCLDCDSEFREYYSQEKPSNQG